MLKYNCAALTARSVTYLASKQALVNTFPSRETQYAEASRIFATKTTKAWEEVRNKLALVAPGDESCFYCERDRYRDIEHVQPKRHYPGRAFDWKNYVFSCVICNQDEKRDKYGVIDGNGNLIEFDRTLPHHLPIPVGTPALIDIRTEDPLDFLFLELTSGAFIPIGNSTSQLKGKFSRDLFDLNSGDLIKIRQRAYNTFVDYLTKWQEAYASHDHLRIQLATDELIGLPYPTVLAEMRRQSANFPALQVLFTNTPSTIGPRERS